MTLVETIHLHPQEEQSPDQVIREAPTHRGAQTNQPAAVKRDAPDK